MNVNGKRTKYTNEVLITIADKLDILADEMRHVANGEISIAGVARKLDWDLRYMRDVLERTMMGEDGPSSKVRYDEKAEVLDDFIYSPIEHLYCDVFGINPKSNDVYQILTSDANEQREIWAWISSGADNRLTPRELQVLKMTYDDYMSLDDIAQEFGVTKERIRQIRAKLQRKLRHPKSANKLRYGLGYISKEEKFREAYIKAREKTREEIIAKKVEEDELVDPLACIPIAALDLSVRAYNCLTRWGKCHTVADLRDTSFEELAKIRNMGKKTLREIITHMRERYVPDFLAGWDSHIALL